MRSFLTFGLLTLAGVASLYACGDDDGGSTPNTGGSGGSSGMGGSAGSSNMAGSGGGGSSGMGGGGGAGGSPNVTPPASNCTGCLQITVPIPATPVDTGDNISQAQAQITAAATDPAFDLSDVTAITWRVQALTLNANYYVQAVVQNSPPEAPGYDFGLFSDRVPLTAPTFTEGGWADITLALPGPTVPDAGTGSDAGPVVDAGPAVTPGDAGDAGSGPLTAFDKSVARIVALNVGALAAAGAGLLSIEVDSLSLTGTSPNFAPRTFDAGAEGLSLNMFYNLPPGSTLTTH